MILLVTYVAGGITVVNLLFAFGGTSISPNNGIFAAITSRLLAVVLVFSPVTDMPPSLLIVILDTEKLGGRTCHRLSCHVSSNVIFVCPHSIQAGIPSGLLNRPPPS